MRTIGDSARAFLSDRYRTLDNFELSEAILPFLTEKGVDIISAQVTEPGAWIVDVDTGGDWEISVM